MHALLIGSRALKHWYEDARIPRDWDLFVPNEMHDRWLDLNKELIEEVRESRQDKFVYILKCGVKVEVELTGEPSVMNFINLGMNMPSINVFGLEARIAQPSTLLAVKRSHIYWPHNWHKHIKDYHFLRQKGVSMTEQEREFYKQRLEEKKAGNPDKTIFSLNVSNEEFFDASEASLGRSFEHDDLHQATCYYDEPLYRKAKRDTTKAMIDRDLFEAMSHEDQCRMVREEAFVIALERRIIPHLLQPVEEGKPLIDVKIIRSAFDYAIMRICTSLTRGWFREFAIENYPAIHHHDTDFVKKFLVALKAGKVREREVSSSQPGGEG